MFVLRFIFSQQHNHQCIQYHFFTTEWFLQNLSQPAEVLVGLKPPKSGLDKILKAPSSGRIVLLNASDYVILPKKFLMNEQMLGGTKNVHFLVKYFIELSFRMAHHLQHFCCNFGFTECVCESFYVKIFLPVQYFLGFFWQVFWIQFFHVEKRAELYRPMFAKLSVEYCKLQEICKQLSLEVNENSNVCSSSIQIHM